MQFVPSIDIVITSPQPLRFTIATLRPIPNRPCLSLELSDVLQNTCALLSISCDIPQPLSTTIISFLIVFI